MPNTLLVHTMNPEIRLSRRTPASTQLQEPQSSLNLLGLLPGPQSPSLFGPNNGPHQLRTHSRRRNTNRRQSQTHVSLPLKDLAALARFPSSPKSPLEASTRMIQIMMQHPGLLPHMITRTLTSIIALKSSNTASATPPGTSTLTLTPNPNAPPPPTLRILQPNPADPPRDPPFRPWTNTDDQELISLKQDTKSRPSWKTIGARLHRDPQVCKLRWGILKQTDQHGRVHPPHEPEAED